MSRANAKARRVPRSEESPEFGLFWAIWQPVMNPNDGRGDARDQFFHHVEVYGADPMDLVDGARWFVRTGGNAEFKLHAQTWLNKRAYEDGADKERAFQARLAEREAKRTAPPPKPIIQPEQPSEDRAAIAKRVYEKLNMRPPEGMH